MFPLNAIASPSEEKSATSEDDVVTEKFDWFKHWWPVQAVVNLETDRPNKIKLLGKDFIVWKGHSGNWIVMDDECPHRMAPLSEGRIEKDGNLLCSYHAWRFNESGKCVKIPHAEDEKAHTVACNSPRSAVQTYPCKTRGSLLWIWPDNSVSAFSDSEKAPVSISDDLADHLEHSHEDGSFYPYVITFCASFEATMENLSDPAHFHTLHHGSAPILNRYRAGPIHAKLSEQTCKERGIYAISFEDPPLLTNATFVLELPGKITYHYGALQDETTSERNQIFLTPLSSSECLMIILLRQEATIANFKRGNIFQRALSSITNLISHLSFATLVDADRLILHLQDRRTRVEGFDSSRDFYTPTNADLLITAVRKWFENEGDHGAAYGGNKPIDQNEQLSREQVLNRYESHTKHCKLCSSALQTIERLISGLKSFRLATAFVSGALIYKIISAESISLPLVVKNAPIVVSVLTLVLSTVILNLLIKLRSRFYYVGCDFAKTN
eukprot:g1719.t1